MGIDVKNAMEDENLSGPHGSRRNYIYLTLAVFVGFLFFGFADSARGPAVPRIQAEFQITELQVGLLLAVNSIGYLIGCSYTAALAKKIGIKSCLIIALAMMPVSGVLISIAPSFAMLVPAFFVLNLGFGMVEIAQGVIAATTFTKRTGTMMNLAHFFYGVGAVFSPVISTGLMAARFGGQLLGWRYMYLIILSCAIVPAIPALIGRLKKQDYNKKKTGYAVILRKPTLWLTILILSLGVTAEMGAVAWLVNFLEKAYSYSSEQAALHLTLFFVCFTLARLVVGPLIDKIGFINSLVFFTALTGVLIVIGVLTGRAGAPLLVIAGAGVAPIFPTVMAAIAKLFTDEIDLAMTSVMTAMGIILVPTNILIGGIVNQARVILSASHGEAGVGLAYASGYMFLGLCCFGSCLFTLILRKRLKNAGQLV
jgi:fucose permease